MRLSHCLLTLLWLGVAAPSRGDGLRAVDLDHLQAAATASDFIATEGAGTVRPWSWRIGALYRYVDRPLIGEIDGRRELLVGTRSLVEAFGSLQFGRWLGLGVVLPVLVESSGSGVVGGAALGDLRLVPRVEIVHARGFGLALLTGLRAPTGATDKLLGEGMVVFEPRLALQGDLAGGRVHLGANLGVRLRESRTLFSLPVGHEVMASVALSVAPWRWLEGLLEVHAASPLSDQFARRQSSPVELLFGARGGARGVLVAAAAGFGVVDGFGAPRWRLMATLEYRRERSIKLVAPVLLAATPPRPPIAAPPPPPPPPPPSPAPVVTAVEAPLDDEADVRFADGRIELGDPVFFALNRKRIRSRFVDELRQLARAILRRPTVSAVWIEGHADATGPKPWNLLLSRQRAAEVARFLAAHGVAAGRLKPVGFGEARPLVSDGASGHNERNRRVQFFTDVAPESSPAVASSHQLSAVEPHSTLAEPGSGQEQP